MDTPVPNPDTYYRSVNLSFNDVIGEEFIHLRQIKIQKDRASKL